VASQQVIVERAETPVMFKRVADEIDAIRQAMQEVEDAGGLRGRKYYAPSTTTASIASASSFARTTTRRRSGWKSAALPAGAMRANV
jgi:hypothetical protein